MGLSFFFSPITFDWILKAHLIGTHQGLGVHRVEALHRLEEFDQRHDARGGAGGVQTDDLFAGQLEVIGDVFRVPDFGQILTGHADHERHVCGW